MNEKQSVILMAVGDVMLGDLPSSFGFGVGSLIKKFGPAFPFELCRDALSKGDIVFGNLEAVLSKFDRRRDKFDQIILRGQPEAISGLAAAGFNIVALANNHIMQHGQKGLEDTIALLSEKRIGFTGIRIPEKNISNGHVIDKKGLKIGFLGYNFRPEQYFTGPPPYVAGDIEIIKADILSFRSFCDLIVLSLHWGDEFIDFPSPDQVALAHELIDSGADIILGHHPHILQGIELYKGRIIAYSLGNFLFDMFQERFRKSIILKLIVRGSDKIDYEIIPAWINKRSQPEIMKGEQREALLKHMDALSRKIDGNHSEQYYRQTLADENRRFRHEIYLHYLTGFYKFKPAILAANIARIIKGRLKR